MSFDNNEVVISVRDLSKCFQVYNAPSDRLKQFIIPRLRKLSTLSERQYYREFWALRDVSFDVKKGETVGIVGRNGSGKSTLLQLICGTLTPTSGSVKTAGRVAALLELGSGFNPEFSGRENIYMNASILGLNRKEIDRKYDDIVRFSEIEDFIEQPVKTYSSGMVVRLAFSVAINVDPEILIVDEALSVGDELFQRKCFSKIESIREKGVTILFVSHSGGTVIELCDRAILIDDGEKLTSGPPKQVVSNYQKLLYAPEDTRMDVRRMVAMEGSEPVLKLHENDVSNNSSTIGSKILSYSDDAFDPNLKPTSTIEYEARGAAISFPEIYNELGERVNILTIGATYYYTYKVDFSKEFKNIKFGMLIKTMSGFELGGAASSFLNGGSLCVAGSSQTVEVKFSFCCLLNPGTYFINAGVVGEINGEETFLHRLIDAALFRVSPQSNRLSTGVVDFGCKAEMRLTS
ncbi:ABC transporter ATP-binding protein [Hahella sp. CR1]|uniref:ABC transporter ATP-binding protein n=1 Tax=Hahella sp. CR1 TaxID=2992807 RepID=UPI002440EEE9|nr:ABC transporter ATP-binding protein [Hahella sp. CR1]MDG9667317.1 ABC transporter ATP-binding protein [Hahella sp. CR1]